MSRSIVIVDWSRDNEVTVNGENEFLWHQMLLSLLYDDVYAQDEVFVCSKKLPKWFSTTEKFRLLEELFQCGGMKVLKRPLARYPSELMERVPLQPINSRREHLAKYSVGNDGAPLTFDNCQYAFHNRLEAFLLGKPTVQHFAGSRKGLQRSIMLEFADLLATVLTDSRYGGWLSAKFPVITRALADEFSSYALNPCRTLDFLAATTQGNERNRLESAQPEFTTALAVRLAATYSPDIALQLQDLVETVFAVPYCRDEKSDGRYGRSLRELPVVQSDGEKSDNNVYRVRVEPIPMRLRLPLPGPNFSDAINRVRESASGRQLRDAMRDVGSEPTFKTATAAWQHVAEDLASSVSRAQMKEVHLSTVAYDFGRGAACGVLASFALQHMHGDIGPLADAAVGAAIDVGGNLYANLLARDLRSRKYVDDLSEAIQFSCVPHFRG